MTSDRVTSGGWQPQTPTPEHPLGGRTAPPMRTGGRYEEFHPDRKYLNAANWFFLGLKVFGYNLLGYLSIALVVLVIFFLIGLLVGN